LNTVNCSGKCTKNITKLCLKKKLGCFVETAYGAPSSRSGCRSRLQTPRPTSPTTCRHAS
jgi:hypothetical protein